MKNTIIRNKTFRWTGFLFIFFLSGIAATVAYAQENDTSNSPQKAETGQVVVLPIEGPIDQTSLFMMRRGFKRIRNANQPVQAVIIELDTPGGALKATKEIITNIQDIDAPVYALVKNQALSAGAIISFATQSIYMQPASQIGSAMPISVGPGGGVQELPDDVKEKLMSSVRSLVRSLAQENGHSEEIGVAMVDRSREVVIGERTVCEEGELLNLTASESVEVIPPRTSPLLAEEVVDGLPSLLEHLGLPSDIKVVRVEQKPAEKLARVITMLAPLLLGIGLVGIYGEISSPGIGIPGLIGGIALALALFGQYVAGLAGWEDIALIVIGLALIAVEIFLVPGFGVPGVLGALALVGGLIMGMIPYIPEPGTLPGTDEQTIAWTDYIENAMRNLILAIITTGIGIWLISRYLPSRVTDGTIVLNTSLSAGAGYTEQQQESQSSLVGKTGTVVSPLRPAGIIRIEGERYDVITTGDLIEKGSTVKVLKVEGNRIVVERAQDDEPPAGREQNQSDST